MFQLRNSSNYWSPTVLAAVSYTHLDVYKRQPSTLIWKRWITSMFDSTVGYLIQTTQRHWNCVIRNYRQKNHVINWCRARLPLGSLNELFGNFVESCNMIGTRPNGATHNCNRWPDLRYKEQTKCRNPFTVYKTAIRIYNALKNFLYTRLQLIHSPTCRHSFGLINFVNKHEYLFSKNVGNVDCSYQCLTKIITLP